MNDEQKEKAKERAAKARAAKAAKTSHVEIVDISGVSPTDTSKLLAEIAGLREKLAESETKRSEETQARIELAKSQSNFLGENEEVATGEQVEIDVLDHYKVVDHHNDGRPILEAVFKKAKIDTYAYRIDLPPCGGLDFKTNGVPFYHGTTVVVDLNVLRDIKERVYRCWMHDKSIHGSDENFYRAPKKQTISARGMR
jgi:hypothetical protein